MSQNLGTLQPKYDGHLKSINFPFGTNGKLMVLGVPILKHFRVFSIAFFFHFNPIALKKCNSVKRYIIKGITK